MKNALRILNVEDCVEDMELNAAMISARWPNSRFTRVDNRAALVEALAQETFDLVLSDYSIPGFNGRDALALVREHSREIPFLFVSGTIGEDTAIEALKNGATDYVLKHRLVRLIPAVDRALRETEERAERERAELAMRESEHKYREMFECLNEAAFLTDEKTGKIIDTNRYAEKLTGCGRGTILGRRQQDYLNLLETNLADIATAKGALSCPGTQAMPVQVHTARLKVYGRPLVLFLCREANGH